VLVFYLPALAEALECMHDGLGAAGSGHAH